MAEPPRLLDRLRAAALARHMSPRTAETYAMWAKRFILFHGKRHPSSMGAEEVNAFLTHLAVDRHVAASTQSQALAGLLFLYRAVLNEPLPWLDDIVRARRTERLPVVLTPDEVRAVLERMHGVPGLVASLLYGAGLRLLEALSLRVKDVDFRGARDRCAGGEGAAGPSDDAAAHGGRSPGRAPFGRAAPPS